MFFFVFISFSRVREGYAHQVEQKVEWLYAFDIHCNAFFPLFILLDVVRFFLLYFLLSPSFLSTFLSNTLYLVAIVFYHYISFLGYTGKNTMAVFKDIF